MTSLCLYTATLAQEMDSYRFLIKAHKVLQREFTTKESPKETFVEVDTFTVFSGVTGEDQYEFVVLKGALFFIEYLVTTLYFLAASSFKPE